MRISVRIDSVLSCDREAIPTDLREAVQRELTIDNPERERAISERVQGAKEMPETIPLWRYEDFKLILPRGYVHRFEALAFQMGHEIEWDSAMTLGPYSERCFSDWRPLALRDYQIPARDAILDFASGILMMPTAGGKSATVLEAARWAGQRTLVIVGKAALAEQWATMALEHYAYEVGRIGEGKWDERDLTVATWQTIWSRRETIPESFYDSFGMVVGDEIHRFSAECTSQVFQRFSAFYRCGVSATPEWDEDLFPIIKAVVGPIVHRTTRADVGERILTPAVKIVRTDFDYEYKPTRMVKGRRQQNNYGDLVAALVNDPSRNDLIARIAREEAQAGHHVLIVTRRIDHVKQLVERLEKVFNLGRRMHVLTGNQKGADATRIAKAIAESTQGTVLISTVADEALDIPRLDRLIMAFPLRRVPLVEQQTGRILRPAAGKADAIVYDLVDSRNPVLRAQASERAQRLFMKRGWRVEQLEPRQVVIA